MYKQDTRLSEILLSLDIARSYFYTLFLAEKLLFEDKLKLKEHLKRIS